jgi:hypothetical protein
MKIHLNNTPSYVFAWLTAASLAVVLAVASPNDASVMGHLPASMKQTALTHTSMSMAQGLTADRTLALITFQRGQHAQAESWIQGLNLNNDASIAWLRMPVFNDPGQTGRSATESRLMQHYPGDSERARLLPVFTDRAVFVRAAGLPGVDQFYAVVVNRDGEVLARVEGQFDPQKARTLRETLLARDL